MKITGIKSYILHPGVGKNIIFVKMETDEGIHGWGEAYTQADRDTSITAHIDKLTRYLIGRDPFHIKQFLHVAYEDFALKRGGMDFWCAVSGIEHCMWDIMGKALNTPVYNLLGGPCRDKIRIYKGGWAAGAKTPQELGRKAAETVKREGLTAIKLDPFPGPWSLYVSKNVERTAIERVAAVREAVGPDVDVLVEVHRRLAPMHAIRVAKAIEQYNPFWYEEPCPAENLDALAEIRRNINIPVVTGEALYTKAQFREVFEKRAADIINPDICNTGGILEFKEIAAMAEPYYVAVAPHGWNSVAVGLAASLQICATIPNFLIMEYADGLERFSHDVMVEPLKVEKGYIKLPTKPGLGIEIREETLAKYAYKDFLPRNVRNYNEMGP